MNRLTTTASLLALSLFAQAPPRFDVAVIKPSAPDSYSGIKTEHSTLNAHNVPVERCIVGAYGVGPRQIVGGPDWMRTDNYEIVAKSDIPVNSDAAMMLMLRTLLAERFKLALHTEQRVTSSYMLEVAKSGPKLIASSPDRKSDTTTGTTDAGITIVADATTLDVFAKVLGRRTDLPVINKTELAGKYDIKLHWVRDDVPDGPWLSTALEQQLGLRLRAQKTPVETLVIDHLERPSEN